MANISVSLPSDGTTADVADYNTPITTVVDEINGNLDNTNIKSGAAISTSKLADDGGIGAAKVADGFVVQVVKTQTGALATGSGVIPADDSIPQNSEGNEYMTLAITPKSATNILLIEVTAVLAASSVGNMIGAIFQDSTADALAAGAELIETANGARTLVFKHTMVAGTTSATTFKFRAGNSNASTTTFNGSAGSRRYGGVSASSIVITEYKAS